jgi:hypothetical protein
VPGYGRLEQRRSEFKSALAGLGCRAVVQSDVLAAIATNNVPREAIAESGINFIRRSTSVGSDYFFTNLSAHAFDSWATLGTPARRAAILDPLTGAAGAAVLVTAPNQPAKLRLQLAPGQSLIVRTDHRPTAISAAADGSRLTGAAPRDQTPAELHAATAQPWPYREPAGNPIPLTGTWSIVFRNGGPEIPPALETAELKSWTELGGEEAKRFGGSARYRIEFDAPATRADDWLLDLGDVRESARVRLNGNPVTTAWSLPFRVRVGAFLQPGRNTLELDVTNLAANRIRDLDQRKVPWKIMREINFVNINYRPFDASGWPLAPSGLLGPVTLIPLKAWKP